MEIIEIIESAGRAPSLKLYPGICLTTDDDDDDDDDDTMKTAC